ncbi:RHS repeat protein [Lysobacter soli]|uniref:RHS repeat protein n=1 Tax=Lysobacter soli TaxID=453783 RepID=UPI0015F27F27|nr:RHS repeat protein [Lysobacter soli]
MHTNMRLARSVCAGLLLSALCGQALAIEVYQEYRKRIESAQNLTALKNDLFGESVSLYNGKTDFNVTDIDLPGNNALPVRLQRRFNVELHLSGTAANFNSNIEGAGGWDVDVPHISGIFAPVEGWAANRCSGSMVPNVNGSFSVNEIWQGNTIHIPGGGDRTMLGKLPETPAPTDGVARKWTTAQRDAIDCIPMKVGLGGGEGFRVTTTQGVRYYFDVATQRYAGQLTKKVSPDMPERTAGRTRVFLLASKIEDRFGNTVEYQYDGDGHPTRIWSSDGREILAGYDGGHLRWASTSNRTWTYEYVSVEGQTRLSRVVLPTDLAAEPKPSWRYSYSNALSPNFIPWDGNSTADCGEQPPEVPANFTFTVEHPSGAIGSFQFSNARHYRSGIHMSQCVRRLTPSEWGSTVYYELTLPNFFDVMSLYSKTISGPGLSQPLTWSYSYGGGHQGLWGSSGSAGAYPCATCPTEKPVIVTNPDGTKTQYRYGFLYALNEGRLLGSSVLDRNGNVVRSEATRYMTTAETAGQPFTTPTYGAIHGLIYNGDDPSTAQIRPVLGTTVVQDGTTYSSTVNSLDALARPVSVTKAGPAYSSTDVTEYFDDQGRWILDQVSKVTNSNTGKVASQTSYNAMSQPYQVWSFGKLQQTITYNADGTAATVKDGRDNTTSLSSWKRGIPQTILYADQTSQSAVVDDRGWINSITDENGSVTGYGYDAMGRLSKIRYPTNDSVVWNDWNRLFRPFTSADWMPPGAVVGQWHSVVWYGSYRKVTVYDARWQPVLTYEYDESNTQPTLRSIRYAYDHEGRNVFSSYPSDLNSGGSTGTWISYDPIGRVESVSTDSELGLLTTLTTYPGGNRSAVTNPRSQTTTTTFFALDQPAFEQAVYIEHPENARTDIARDVFGKPKAITRRNIDGTQSVTRSYVYDVYEQLCKAIEPETGASVTDYDAAGNIAWTASGLALPGTTSCDTATAYGSGRRADRTYDARNRVKTLTFPDGSGNQTWTYTNDGKPSQVITQSEGGVNQTTNIYNYNKRGLLTSETTGQAGWFTWALGYGYDANGALASITYPSGLVVDYAPNALGQPTRAGVYALGVSYYPNGGMKQFTYGNGIVHSMMQNARQLPSRVTDGAVLDDTYAYDRNGNVSQITDAVTPGYSRSMVYDNLDRLTQAASAAFGGDGIYRYTYDALDNLRSAKLTGKRQHNYWYDASNRLTNIQDNAGATIGAIGYDVQGNVQNKSGDAFQFDFGNRLRSVAGKEAYWYDAYGRRARAWSPTQGNILSMYGQDGALRRQNNEREGKNYEYIQLNGSLLAKLTTVVAPVTPALTVPSYSTTGSYTLTWTSVAYATSYDLQESANGGAWTPSYGGAGLSKAVSGKTAGSYAYRVRACQAAACSGWSASQSTSVQFAPTAAATVSSPANAPNGNFTVSWTSVAGADRYVLEHSVNGGAWATAQDSAAVSVAYTSKPAGTYAYRVNGCNPAGCGPVSATATTQVVYPPASAPVLSVPAQSLTGGYTVSWGAVSTATTYRLEESVNGGGWVQVQEPAATSTAFSGKAYGAYAYRARACNLAGCGGYSGSVSISVIRPPSDATWVSVPTLNTNGSYTVSWGGVGLATSYQAEESVNGGGWSLIYNAGGTSVAVGGKGTATYSYRVRGCNAAGCGPDSAVASVQVVLPPPAPTITYDNKYQLIVSGRTKIACSVRWTASSFADRYELWSYGNGNYYQKQYDGTATSVGTSINQNVATYCASAHVVRACNASGCSESAPVAQTVTTEYADGGVIP